MLERMAVDNDYQVWIERVDSSGKVGFVIEDGMLVSSGPKGDSITDDTAAIQGQSNAPSRQGPIKSPSTPLPQPNPKATANPLTPELNKSFHDDVI